MKVQAVALLKNSHGPSNISHLLFQSTASHTDSIWWRLLALSDIFLIYFATGSCGAALLPLSVWRWRDEGQLCCLDVTDGLLRQSSVLTRCSNVAPNPRRQSVMISTAPYETIQRYPQDLLKKTAYKHCFYNIALCAASCMCMYKKQSLLFWAHTLKQRSNTWRQDVLKKFLEQTGGY